MNGKLSTLLMLLLSAPLTGFAGEQLIPAGSIISCTVSEPRISSKTTNIGDPVLCKVGHIERYGRSTLPYQSYMEGRFEDYKDPGHFVGKGWMELVFDRMVIEPDTVIPVDARVVSVPGYNVDRLGRILGKGHAVRDIVEWSIPILWPIDLLNLPRRGPRPTLKEETRLTLKIMDDFGVPPSGAPQWESPGLQRRPTAYQPEPPQQTVQPTAYQPPPPQQQSVYQPPPPQQTVVQTYVQPVYLPAQPVYYQYVEPPPVRVYYYQPQVYYPPQVMVRNANPYWVPY
jgi:hypothetical protein